MPTTIEPREFSSRVRRVNHAQLQTDPKDERSDAQGTCYFAGDKQQVIPARQLADSRIRNWPQFFVLWQIIGCVSAYDAYLAMKYRVELNDLEQNWLGRLLLYLDGGDPALFLGIKFLGTIVVLGILANLYHSRPQSGIVVAQGVALFQILLLVYLTLG